jgi:hypothetical protein
MHKNQNMHYFIKYTKYAIINEHQDSLYNQKMFT